MDLCGPMRVTSVNRKKYILVIVDDYSRFTWVKCLRLKDEAPDFIIKFLKMIQVRLKTPIRRIRTDNGTEFFNQTLRKYYEQRKLGKLQPKAEIGIFIGYAPTKKSFRIYNLRTRRIIEIIHVDFDELTAMAFEQSSSGPTLHEMIPATISSGLMPNPHLSTLFVPPSRTNWDMLFQLLFDELLTPPPSVDHPAPEVIALTAETYKDALTQSCWIKAMHEKLNEFECLGVWELVPRPDKVMVITLKWIYKVKLDELGGILKNKARKHQSCGSCVVGPSAIMMSLIRNMKCEYGVMNLRISGQQLQSLRFLQGFVAAVAVLKPERLKVDKARNE
nr:Gag-Pol polyprotein [Tanacetum cinerariifolium]